MIIRTFNLKSSEAPNRFNERLKMTKNRSAIETIIQQNGIKHYSIKPYRRGNYVLIVSSDRVKVEKTVEGIRRAPYRVMHSRISVRNYHGVKHACEIVVAPPKPDGPKPSRPPKPGKKKNIKRCW